MAKKCRWGFRIVGIALIVLFLAIIVWIGVVVLARPSYMVPDTTEWETGDIFFSVGNSWKSVAVRAITGAKHFELTDSTPSHCGMVIRDAEGIKLVHASTSAKKVVAETIEDYIANNGSCCLYVIPQHLPLDTIKLKSDIDSILKIPVKFDFEFNHSDGKSLYCTELVVTLLELNGCFFLSPLREKHHIYPQDIINTLNLTN